MRSTRNCIRYVLEASIEYQLAGGEAAQRGLQGDGSRGPAQAVAEDAPEGGAGDGRALEARGQLGALLGEAGHLLDEQPALVDRLAVVSELFVLPEVVEGQKQSQLRDDVLVEVFEHPQLPAQDLDGLAEVALVQGLE
eukprot:scaffold549273_cov44-Prasinocladus_malaysianus.AAC.1